MSTSLLKNVASQRIRVYAYTPADGLPKTGDAANLTAYIAKDYGAVTALTDTSATEEDATNAAGFYWFDVSQTETNADNIMVTGKSSTSGVKVLGAPAIIGTRPATGFLAPATAGRTLVVDANGNGAADVIRLLGTPWLAPGTAGTPDVNTKTITNGAIAAATFAANALDAVWSTAARTLTSFGTLAADVWAIATSTLTAAGTIGKKLADWVVGTIDTYTGNTKQTGDAFARIGAAGAGLTALGDTRIANLDASVSSRGTGTALDAAGVRSAVGLATANIDTQLAAIQADSPNRVTKNVALAGFTFFMRDSTNHAAATGLTITAQRSLDGAAFGACANSATEVSNGLYTIDLAAADLNGNVVSLRFTAAGADDLVISFPTQPT